MSLDFFPFHPLQADLVLQSLAIVQDPWAAYSRQRTKIIVHFNSIIEPKISTLSPEKHKAFIDIFISICRSISMSDLFPDTLVGDNESALFGDP